MSRHEQGVFLRFLLTFFFFLFFFLFLFLFSREENKKERWGRVG